MTGVKKGAFYRMGSILQEAEVKKKARGRSKNKLSIEKASFDDTLNYIREYRTYFLRQPKLRRK
ncbi:hypothetical protein [Holospora elegans]|uniref:hypothetical protein n=1 Tax=Holospora elegans TaxID=431043 RepID=UPI000698C0A2|nr:hypothetical protein [Holospora elegans]